MPQPTLLSGVAGEVHSTAYQGPQIGEQLVAMAEAFTRVKQAEQANALQKLNVMLSNVDKLPIDEKAIRKEAKKAGIPLADDGTIAAIAKAGRDQKNGGQPPTGPSGVMGTVPQGDATNKKAVAAGQLGGVSDATKKFQQNMTPEQGANSVFSQWIARQRNAAKAEYEAKMARTEADKKLADLDSKTAELKQTALKGGPEGQQAAGLLMGSGQVPFNLSQLAWQQGTLEQKQTLFRLALGYDQGKIFDTLVKSGMPAAEAFGVSDKMFKGEALTPEEQKAANMASFDKLEKQAELYKTVQEMGAPPEQVGAIVKKAQETGNLTDALPKNMKPIWEKELSLRQRQVAAEERRVGVAEKAEQVAETREARLEKESDRKYQLNFAKLKMMELQGENKDILNAIKITSANMKNGIKMDPKEVQKVLDQMQSIKIEDPADFLKYMSGQPSTAVPGSGNPVEDELGPMTMKGR